ncbi:MAG: DNA translocase FtsK 4TM domain-containing protein, partial [Alphaproteobacteria bacterium]|nr:DNA translocase FtsK 4TM domain-containing protein [Alphaproteobacteria bacterium]
MIKKTKQKKSHAPRYHFLVEVFGRRWGRQLINLCQWGLALVFFLLGLALFAALLGYDPTDPSFTTLSSGPIKNPMGVFGAAVSDIGFSFLGGLASYALPLLCLLWGWSLADNNQPHHGARTSNLDQHHTILKNLSLLHFLAALCWLVLLAALPPLALRTFESLLPNLSMAWLPAGWGDSNSNAGFSSLLGVFWYHLFAQSPFNGP